MLRSLTTSPFLLFITPRALSPSSLLPAGREEAPPVHLRSVRAGSVVADARQLPGDDLGDRERPRAQDPLGHGQAHPVPQHGLDRSVRGAPRASLELLSAGHPAISGGARNGFIS